MAESLIVTDKSILRIKSENATASEATEIIKKLETELAKHPHGVGLSAIQIGIPKRVAIIRRKKNINLINPMIINGDDVFVSIQEGCLSIPGKHCNVNRWAEIVFDNMEIVDDKLETRRYQMSMIEGDQNSDGIETIAVQHEIDHMDGQLMIDHEIQIQPLTTKVTAGRNDPCPCGSGKKYKKCCMDK